MTLQVPSQFYYEWLESHYKIILMEALETVIGVPGQIKYSVVLGEEPVNERPAPIPRSKEHTDGFSRSPQLNQRFTFSNFIEGSGNQFAKAAARAICDNPQNNVFNPLLIYGGVGLGKTHLLQAIGNQYLADTPNTKIIYTTSEKFTQDFISSIQNNKAASFTKYYRNVDMLLVDDIQFFQKKEQTKEHFFHTFNDLYQRGKQIIMTLDRPPAELDGLTDRLISRFQSGLVVDIQPPDFETRIAILRRRAEEENLQIPGDTIEYIATCILSNVRELEGALIRLLAYSSLRREEITMDLARKVVQEMLGKQATKNVTVDEIIQKVSTETSIRENLLIGKGRQKNIAQARQLAMYLARELTDSSLVNIGLHFAGRDHTTVIHACRKVEEMMGNSTQYQARVDQLRHGLANNVFN